MSLIVGGTISQISTGYIFDHFKPKPDWFLYTDASYVCILPFLLLFWISLNLIAFLLSFLIFKFSKNYLERNMQILVTD
jgi:hypothetical protein